MASEKIEKIFSSNNEDFEEKTIETLVLELYPLLEQIALKKSMTISQVLKFLYIGALKSEYERSLANDTPKEK